MVQSLEIVIYKKHYTNDYNWFYIEKVSSLITRQVFHISIVISKRKGHRIFTLIYYISENTDKECEVYH